MIKRFVFYATDKAGLDTKTEFESAVCLKLTWAYTLNSVLTPFLLGALTTLWISGKRGERQVVDQSWFEAGGAAGQAFSLIIVTMVVKDTQKMLPILPLLNRLVRARFASSQAQLNALYRPPALKLGELYADTLKTVALGMIYGPLYPVMFLLVAVALVYAYFCTKVGLSQWYMRPPKVNQDMMASLRTNLGLMVALMIIPMGLGASAVSADDDDGKIDFKACVFIAAPLAWLLYSVLPLGKIRALSDHSQVDDIDAASFDWDTFKGDTKGIRIEDVTHEKGYEVLPYICPKISAVMRDAMERFVVDMLAHNEAVMQSAKKNEGLTRASELAPAPSSVYRRPASEEAEVKQTAKEEPAV